MALTKAFCNTGDRTEFSVDTDPQGDMSWEKGFTQLFQLTPQDGGLYIDRQKFNQMMYEISNAVIDLQNVTIIDDETTSTEKTWSSNKISTELSNIITLLPGSVIAWAGKTSLPSGYLLCDGAAVSRTTYAELYSAIGTTYGTGDGSTTFNLPNLTDRFIQGNATSGTAKAAGLPNITGSDRMGWLGIHFGWVNNDTGGKSGCFIMPDSVPANNSPIDSTIYRVTAPRGVKFDASQSNAIYGRSTTVQPPALTMRYIIKY